MSFSKEEVRTIIKFSVLLGKSASAIHAELAQVLGEESAPGLSTVKRWAVKFREGEAEVSDAPRSGRPRTATTDDNVALVQELLAEDRRLTVQEISLEVGISEGNVWDILHNKLQKRKKCARWVPHRRAEGLPHHTGSWASSTVQEGRRCFLGQNSNRG
ncbi:protein GVQW3-like [Oratosquilla oratoria]|uniref:protein GVQW3-like n=1 Tax=Oratosquilla oratoria TaxID=337810 RepID=UPI003F767D60